MSLYSLGLSLRSSNSLFRRRRAELSARLFCVNIYVIEVNGIKIEIKNGYSNHGLFVGQKVILSDDYDRITPEEAEKVVEYLYLEGFIDRRDVYLEVI